MPNSRSPVTVTVVTPTKGRPSELADLLVCLANQERQPDEVIVVDGSDLDDRRTENAIGASGCLGFRLVYLRARGGAALQRNAGVDAAAGQFVAFIDDDVRPHSPFLRVLLATLQHLPDDVAAAAGRLHGVPHRRARRVVFQLLHAVGLLGTHRPGAFDRASGHAIPRNFEPDERLREVDIVGGGATLWRRQVFDDGLRFAEFFRTFFSAEDEHLALMARRRYRLVTVADARYDHLFSCVSRAPPELVARHGVINRRFIFVDTVPTRTRRQEARFWAIVFAEMALRTIAPLSRPNHRVQELRGTIRGAAAAYRRWPGRFARTSPHDRSDEI